MAMYGNGAGTGMGKAIRQQRLIIADLPLDQTECCGVVVLSTTQSIVALQDDISLHLPPATTWLGSVLFER